MFNLSCCISDFATKVECQLAIDSFDSVNEVDMVCKAIQCFDKANSNSF